MNTTPGLGFMQTVMAQISADKRFAKLGGRMELRQQGLGENPDGTPFLGVVFVTDINGHEYVHCVNARQNASFSPGHPVYGEFSVVMVTRRGGKKFHECPVLDGRLTEEGLATVLRQLASGVRQMKKIWGA